MTSLKKRMCIAINENGEPELWDCVRDACRHYGIREPVARYHMKNNRPINFDTSKSTGVAKRYKQFEINGKVFKTAEEGAKYFNMTKPQFWRFNQTRKRQAPAQRYENFTLDGKVFKDANEASEYFDVNLNTIYLWVKNPSVFENRSKFDKIVDGKIFKNTQEVMDFYDVNRVIALEFVKSGKSRKIRKKPKISGEVMGIKYESLKDLSRITDVPYRTLQDWHRDGILEKKLKQFVDED